MPAFGDVPGLPKNAGPRSQIDDVRRVVLIGTSPLDDRAIQLAVHVIRIRKPAGDESGGRFGFLRQGQVLNRLGWSSAKYQVP